MSDPSDSPLGLDRASIWMIAGALALASMGALASEAGSRCDWLVVALVRAILMLGTAVTIVRASGSELVFWRPRTLWVRSLAGSFSLVCNFYALTRLPIADAVTLMNVHPLWIVLITSVAKRRWPSKSEAFEVLSGIAGVVLVAQGMGGTASIGRPHLSGDRLAILAAILSSLSTAVAMLGLHRLRNIDSRSVVAHFAGVASVISAVLLYFRGDPLPAELFERSTTLAPAGRGRDGHSRPDPADEGLCGRGASEGRRGRPHAGRLRHGLRRRGLASDAHADRRSLGSPWSWPRRPG